MVDRRRESEGEGTGNDEGGEFELESFVSFDVGEPEACDDVGAGLLRFRVDRFQVL